MSNSAPKFNFGNLGTSGSSNPATTSSSGNAGGLFGSNNSTAFSMNNSTASGAGLFGNLNNPTSGASQQPSLFSGVATSGSTGQAPSIFGGQSGGGNAFGGAGNAASGGFSFQPAAQGSGETAGKTSAPATTGQTQTSSVFGGGANSSGTSLFSGLGSSNASSAPAGSTTPATSKNGAGLSFNTSTTPAGPPPALNSGGSSGGLFSFNQNQQTNSVFGNKPNTQSSAQQMPPPPAQSNIFGSFQPGNSAKEEPAPTSNIFGSAGQSGGSNVLGNNGVSQTGDNIFSALNKPQDSASATTNKDGNPTPSTNMFGQQTEQTQPNEPSKQTNLFGDLAQQNTSATAQKDTATPSFSGLAGGLDLSKPQAKPSSFFPSIAPMGTQSSSSPATTAATTTTTTTPASNLFGNLGSSAASTQSALASTSAAASNPFANMGKPAQKQNSSSSATVPSISATSAPVSSPNVGTTVPTLNLFPSATPATTAPTSQPAGTTATAAPTTGTSATTLGASTTGPAPPAQSRLKNKSMDEIITRWANDLSKYQKEFQNQAEKVSIWDRLLVENGDQIQKLYASTFEAERASAEVERQLSAVEGQQDELSGWLDKYEKEVDEMMSKRVGQGEAMQVPDQERERTYKLAEKLSERLDEMGKDLTSMIEGINDASFTLSKTSKPDDPLSQVVRVLNSHLSQLQMIDQGAAALQAKVTAAQKAVQGLGTNGYSGHGNDAVNDFYKSYMGRR